MCHLVNDSTVTGVPEVSLSYKRLKSRGVCYISDSSNVLDLCGGHFPPSAYQLLAVFLLLDRFAVFFSLFSRRPIELIQLVLESGVHAKDHGHAHVVVHLFSISRESKGVGLVGLAGGQREKNRSFEDSKWGKTYRLSHSSLKPRLDFFIHVLGIHQLPVGRFLGICWRVGHMEHNGSCGRGERNKA